MAPRPHRCTLCQRLRAKCDGLQPACTQCVKKANGRPGVQATDLCFYVRASKQERERAEQEAKVVEASKIAAEQQESARKLAAEKQSEIQRLEKIVHSVVHQAAPLLAMEEKEAAEERKRLRRNAETERERKRKDYALPSRGAALRQFIQDPRCLKRAKEQAGLAPEEEKEVPGLDLNVILQAAGLSLEASAARGGYGAVYKVSADVNPESFFGMKISLTRQKALHAEDALEERAVLMRERQRLQFCSGLRNVVQLAEVPGLASNEVGLVWIGGEAEALLMTWVNKVSFTAAVADTTWRQGGALRCIRGMLNGVAGIHSRQLVHGDLKPGNVLICKDKDGKFDAMIVDLGLAQTVNIGLNRYGTAGFRAPEIQDVNRDGRKRCDQLAIALDAWACGVCALIYATGERYLFALHANEHWHASCERQDKMLAQKAREDRATQLQSPWPMTVAREVGKEKHVHGTGVYKMIKACLAYEATDRQHPAKILERWTLRTE